MNEPLLMFDEGHTKPFRPSRMRVFETDGTLPNGAPGLPAGSLSVCIYETEWSVGTSRGMRLEETGPGISFEMTAEQEAEFLKLLVERRPHLKEALIKLWPWLELLPILEGEI